MTASDTKAAGAALLLDKVQSAALMNVSARTFLRLVASGKAPKPVHIGRLVRWKRADLERWISSLATGEGSGVTP